MSPSLRSAWTKGTARSKSRENGLRGGLGYFDAHGSEPHVGAIESDSGMGAPTGFSLAGDDAEAFAALLVYQPLFSALAN